MAVQNFSAVLLNESDSWYPGGAVIECSCGFTPGAGVQAD